MVWEFWGARKRTRSRGNALGFESQSGKTEVWGPPSASLHILTPRSDRTLQQNRSKVHHGDVWLTLESRPWTQSDADPSLSNRIRDSLDNVQPEP